MTFERVFDLVDSGQFDQAVKLLNELPLECLSAERIRPWVFHAHDDLRQRVVTLLGRKFDVDSIADLARLFEAALDFYDHDFIFEAYTTMGELALPGLQGLVLSGSEGQRSAALQGLGQIGGAAVPFLIERLLAGDGDELVFLALENSADARAVPALLAYLDEHPEDDEAASAMASCSDTTCGRYVAEMARVLTRTRSQEVRRSVVEAMGETGSPSAVRPLKSCLRVPGAAEALGNIADPAALAALIDAVKGTRSGNALDAVLMAILTHPLASDEQRREVARMCLRRSDLPETTEKLGSEPACRLELERAAASQDPHCRLILADALEKEEAAPHYEFVSRCGDRGLLRTLASKGRRLPMELADHLARSPDGQVRWNLACSTRWSGALRSLLSDREARVREAAVWSLDRNAEAFPQLCDLRFDRSRRVRSAAANVIRRLTEVDIEERIAALERFLRDRFGRPTDLELGAFVPLDGGEEQAFWLSESIQELRQGRRE